MVTFLRGWRSLFSELGSHSFILASESYGGHYVPAWANAIMYFNEDASDPILLKGLLMSNGIVDNQIQGADNFVLWAKMQRLIPEDAHPKTEIEARALVAKTLGYKPNYYDYRLEDFGECCGCFGYNYSTWSHWLIKKQVTKALNVCGNAGDKAFAGCAGGCIQFTGCKHGFDHSDMFNYTTALRRALAQHIPISLFYGKQDTACNYVGGYAMAEAAGCPDFKKDELQELIIGGATTGEYKARGGLTWIQINGAGHMTPVNNAGAAYYALEALLDQPTDGASQWAFVGAVTLLILCPIVIFFPPTIQQQTHCSIADFSDRLQKRTLVIRCLTSVLFHICE